MKKSAIIVAGGSGVRMGSDVPKQFLLLNDIPVLIRTLQLFHAVADEVVLVLPQAHFDYWEKLRNQFSINKTDYQLVAGGSSRTESVINGLEKVNSPGLVAIHDAVRPLVSKELISHAFETAAKYGSAIPVIPVRETLRKVENSSSIVVDREQYRLVQTPQCFDIELIKKAYQQFSSNTLFTDDAGVYEAAGNTVHLIEGEHSNIKITFPADLIFASAWLNARFS
ncbi:MAG: 2-C-methyl-D-erythritol 4-phosphate cytidylyltransferase [Bacteroidetes bacterium]|nr:2-C-methyl-D-erythritol 4-phosphate cytidylyltransferase [Bacteroidota bacterium]